MMQIMEFENVYETSLNWWWFLKVYFYIIGGSKSIRSYGVQGKYIFSISTYLGFLEFYLQLWLIKNLLL